MRERRKAGLLVPGLLVLGMVLGGGGVGAQEPPPAKKPAPGGRYVLPQVREARDLEGALKGLKGEKRRKAQLEAARAWAKAAEALKDDPGRAARAVMREAILLGLAGEGKEAEAAWQKVLQLAPDRLGARALVGLGDLARRARKTGKALEFYQEAVKRFPKGGAPVQQALLWVGKLHMGAGRMDKAREAFLQVARVTTSAGRMAYAYDLVVQAWLRQGDLEKAKAAYEEAKEALGRLGRGGDKRKAKAVERALAGMRSPARIERALRAAGKKPAGKEAPKNRERRP